MAQLQLIGLGRIGRDVELRYTANNDAVANVSLAFNYGRKGEDGKRPTTWVEASLWNKRAEALAPYLLKGQQVYVIIDDAHTEEYQRKDGGTGTKLVGTIQSIELASSGQQQQQQQQAAQQPRQAPQQQRPAQAPRQAPQPQRQHQQFADDGFSDMSDDIPF